MDMDQPRNNKKVRLTENVRDFAWHVSKGMAPIDAYYKAYPNSRYMKPHEAVLEATRLLAAENVGKLLGQYVMASSGENYVTARKLVERWATLASADIRDYVNVQTREVQMEDGSTFKQKFVHIRDTDDLTDAQAQCIKKIKQGKHGIEIELHDPTDALKEIGKLIGAYRDDVSQDDEQIVFVDDLVPDDVSEMQKIMQLDKPMEIKDREFDIEGVELIGEEVDISDL